MPTSAPDSPLPWLVVAGIFLFAGFIKGVIAIGSRLLTLWTRPALLEGQAGRRG